ncbi:MAG TPA: hypothetical protein VF941_09055 [Clostridia bacterium]
MKEADANGMHNENKRYSKATFDWIEDGKLINIFVGGDSNFDEITAEEEQKVIEKRGWRFQE